ncbi:zinc-binding dehydrogenase [Actinoplanes sp. LDG1-06]|uniref:Zinc-binding dehydrogenase n=1 Tax=Paractinoplanes ovalisporus TaxID=2810368 RepID=A0ABS2AVI1_9ACTN|nr:zinc-binding dehydrogenase [Actinoplanes ovalisporus]MBM2623887.1 zinc-binding dehydrogenase [Actinoplanes ovalisporus]
MTDTLRYRASPTNMCLAKHLLGRTHNLELSLVKAIQMSETGQADVLRLVELPDPQPGPGEVLVRVEAAGVNFMDIYRRKGLPFDIPTPLPFVPGGELAGTIVALGDGVENLNVGDRVFGQAGPLANGGYAELVAANAAGLFPIPPGMDAESAAGLSVVAVSAAILLTGAARLSAGETVFVPAAAGGLGSYAVQIAKALGATVIAGAGTPEKRRIAIELGADHAVDYRAPGWTDEIKQLTGGRGVDVALEMTGPGHVAETLSVLAPFGRLIGYGYVAEQDHAIDSAALMKSLFNPAPGHELIGFNVGYWYSGRPQASAAAAARVMGWLADGTLTGPQVTTFPLADAADAHTRLERGATIGKVVLIP